MSKLFGAWNISVNTGMSWESGTMEFSENTAVLGIFGYNTTLGEYKVDGDRMMAGANLNTPWGMYYIQFDLSVNEQDQLTGYAAGGGGSYPIAGKRA